MYTLRLAIGTQSPVALTSEEVTNIHAVAYHTDSHVGHLCLHYFILKIHSLNSKNTVLKGNLMFYLVISSVRLYHKSTGIYFTNSSDCLLCTAWSEFSSFHLQWYQTSQAGDNKQQCWSSYRCTFVLCTTVSATRLLCLYSGVQIPVGSLYSWSHSRPLCHILCWWLWFDFVYWISRLSCSYY